MLIESDALKMAKIGPVDPDIILLKGLF